MHSWKSGIFSAHFRLKVFNMRAETVVCFKRACVKKDKSTPNQQDSASDTKNKIPFVQGLSEKIKCVYSQYGASTVFKPHQTLRQLLVAPKDQASDEEKSGIIYRYPCKGCDKVYIGKTKRSLGDLIKEHCAKTTSNQSALAEHSKNTGHELDTGNVTVLCREDKLIPRKVREVFSSRKNF